MILKYLPILALFAACKFTPQPVCPPCVCPCDTTVVVPPVDTTRSGEFILGVNTNIWQPKEQQSRLMGTRLYMPIGWAWTESGFYGQPLKQGQKQFLGLDDYLSYMKSKGVDVVLCLMQSPDFLNGHTQGINTNDFPPIRPGADKNDPKSYAEIASIYSAFAKRYGSKVWPKNSYKIDPALPRWNGDERQVEKSGLNLVKTIEVGNEPGRWWSPEQMLNAEQYAAMLLTCYDSIKAGDPNMGVVMAGTTNYELPYVKGMNDWFKRKGRAFPSIAVNIHHYQSSGNLPGVHPPNWPVNSGVNWDQDKDFVTASQVVTFARSIGLESWISEYGFDSQPGSQVYPAYLNGKTAEETQAEWLVSTTLEYKRIGFSRAYLFTMADEPAPSGTFTSSGLLRGEPLGYAEKKSMQAISDLCAALKAKKLVFSLQ